MLPNSRAINEQYRAIQGFRMLPSFGIAMLPAQFSRVCIPGGISAQPSCSR